MLTMTNCSTRRTLWGTLTPLAGGGGVGVAISATASFEHWCVVLADSTARCWGRNDSGQLGNGTTTDSNVPVPVLGN